MSAPPVAAPGAGDLLTLAEVQSLRRTSTARGIWLVLHAWVVILGAMAASALWPSPLTVLVGIAVVGGRPLGLTVLAHETAHWRLFTGMKQNGWAAKLFCAWPMGSSCRRTGGAITCTTATRNSRKTPTSRSPRATRSAARRCGGARSPTSPG